MIGLVWQVLTCHATNSGGCIAVDRFEEGTRLQISGLKPTLPPFNLPNTHQVRPPANALALTRNSEKAAAWRGRQN